jgi:hypothetical protein
MSYNVRVFFFVTMQDSNKNLIRTYSGTLHPDLSSAQLYRLLNVHHRGQGS